MRNILSTLVAELETPRAMRPFGTGWISGTAGLGLGVAATLMAVALRHPGLLTTPELAVVTGSAAFRIALAVVLVAGYLCSLTSLVLREKKLLGLSAMVLVLVATLIGGLPPRVEELQSGAFFGLDFFVLNVLFLGFLFVPLERLFPAHPEQTVLRAEWRIDLFYYLVSSLLVQVLTYLTLAPSHFILGHADWTPVHRFFGSLPVWVQFPLVMLFADLAQYATHSLFHRIPALWRFHAVHHSAETMDWIAGARMHFLEIIVLRAIAASPMFLLGFDGGVIQAYILFAYVHSSFVHANLNWRFGWLEHVLVFPRYHHWHHAMEREAWDKNFAVHFPFIDRLFGTHYLPKGKWPEAVGIGDPMPKTYLGQFLYPFRRPRA